MGKIFYYSDEINDDFAGTKIKTKSLPADYEYIPKSKIRKATARFFFHVFVQPICAFYMYVLLGQKIVGRKKIKPYKKSGYFLYGNHTRMAGDAFTPSLISYPKQAYIVAHDDSVSIPGIKWLVEDLGAMPVPNSLTLGKKFLEAVEERVNDGNPVAIYPEAHIWPLYTGIRNFPCTSFSYPVKMKKPVFVFTTTYRKRKFLKGVKATVYVDGPFFPDSSLSVKEQKQKLRDEVFYAMCKRSELSTYSPNRFIKK